MASRSRGLRSRTRKKLTRKLRRKGITRFLKNFDIGEKVVIVPDPSSHKGMPFPRYKGRVGVITGKRGKAYLVEILDGSKKKIIISRPEHLKKI